jgi:regulator of replication initiation timing
MAFPHDFIIMASSSQSRLARYNRILHNPFPAATRCDRCDLRDRDCFFIADLSIMSCSECTRLGRPCVTSSIDRLDKVVDDLSAKIKTDEGGVEEALNKIVALSSEIESLRQRIARNKVVREQNNKRLDAQLRHVADTSSLTGLNEGFSSAATLGQQVRQAGLEDPFDWSFEPDLTLATAEPDSGGTLQSASATQNVH